jgi:hypothetical protein
MVRPLVVALMCDVDDIMLPSYADEERMCRDQCPHGCRLVEAAGHRRDDHRGRFPGDRRWGHGSRCCHRLDDGCGGVGSS